MSDTANLGECAYCTEQYKTPTNGDPTIDYNIPEGKLKNLQSYLKFLETDPIVSQFLRYDKCRTHADKYMLAIVFKYFSRLNVHPTLYSKDLFFKALSLALNVYEGANREARYGVYLWAQDIRKAQLRDTKQKYHKAKFDLFIELNCKTLVCQEWCDKIFKLAPNSSAFQRTREAGHSGVHRGQLKYIRGKCFKVRSYGTCSRCSLDGEQNFMHANLPLSPPHPDTCTQSQSE